MAENGGRFQVGNRYGKKFSSGNKHAKSEVAELALSKCVEAIEIITKIMLDVKASNKDRLQASTVLLDRGLGKCMQYIESVNVTTQTNLTTTDDKLKLDKMIADAIEIQKTVAI